MKILTARRIAQVFFLALFTWLCVVATVGTAPWQWRGWPINAFLQFDPLVAVGTALSTHSLYSGLAWALVTIAVTMLLGRVFCGWVCPFGTLHQFLGLGEMGLQKGIRGQRHGFFPRIAMARTANNSASLVFPSPA